MRLIANVNICCDECGKRATHLIELGDSSDNPVRVCINCMRDATSLVYEVDEMSSGAEAFGHDLLENGL